MTRERINANGEGMILTNIDEARRAFENGSADLQAMVKIRVPISVTDDDGNVTTSIQTVDTTVGRALLSGILPEGLSFDLVNKPMSKKPFQA